MTRSTGRPRRSAGLLVRSDRKRRRRPTRLAQAIRRCIAGVSAVVVGAAVPACSSGDDAVAQGGSFEFVSPGGQVDILYDPPENRGRPGTIRGPDLLDPNRTVSVEDFAGRVVVINVWGQWCGPCRTEMPELQRVYDATRAAGVAFLGIDVRDNNRQAAIDFIVDRKVTFPSIYDPPMRTMVALGARYPTTVIPTTIVLDRAHRVAAVFLRALLAEDLEPVVRRLAAEAAIDAEPPQ
ncbi:TlpA family protein disulfide reductase [Mycolicibacterium arseniciresistens]|uniref:TlpA disulfide reductase family protein n=1 Tax=Mycolicibacterium arseniciresistens TaxID=3062257 RepID=A0ABT8UCW0_9MYCO|nr:TlpA disulfide reductase family protein [Mycolicibacterium arseniciresistens]MDO3634705.1 TlpA disulfide reductase family protein [Mycolicibacterium arseniciresistens]